MKHANEAAISWWMREKEWERLSSSYLRRSLSEEEASSLETMQSVDLCKVSSSSRTPTAPAPVISESLDFRPPGSRPNRRTQSTPPCGPMVRWWLNWSPPDVSGSLGNQSLERLPAEKLFVNSEKMQVAKDQWNLAH